MIHNIIILYKRCIPVYKILNFLAHFAALAIKP